MNEWNKGWYRVNRPGGRLQRLHDTASRTIRYRPYKVQPIWTRAAVSIPVSVRGSMVGRTVCSCSSSFENRTFHSTVVKLCWRRFCFMWRRSDSSWPNVPVWPGQSRFRVRCPGVPKGYVRDAFMSRFAESCPGRDREHHLWLSRFHCFINAIVSESQARSTAAEAV